MKQYITDSESVAVDADSSFTADVKSEAGKQGDEPSGGSVGVTGTVGVGVYVNNTRAVIESDEAVISDGEVHVGAAHVNDIKVETGADAAGSTAAIGASIAISVSDANTEALLSSNTDGRQVLSLASSSKSE